MRADRDERRVPLEVADFAAFPRPAGRLATRLDVATIAIEFAGLPDDLAAPMARAYGPYMRAPDGAGAPLRIEARAAPLDYFLPPRFTERWENYRVLTAFDGCLFRSIS